MKMILRLLLILCSPTLFATTETPNNSYVFEKIDKWWFASPWSLRELNGVIVFNANDGANGEEVWRSDGTAAGTYLIKDVTPGDDPFRWFLTKSNQQVFFSAHDGIHGWELWKTDGTEKGTVLVKDIKSGGDSEPYNLTDFREQLVFSAVGNYGGEELWLSDGTARGTMMVKDLNDSGTSSYPSQFVVGKKYLFFTVNAHTETIELWKSDGSTQGTQLITQFPNPPKQRLNNLMPLGNHLFFVVDDDVHGKELWKTDGQRTQLVKDIHPTGDANPNRLVVMQDTLYFVADDGVHGDELWKSDGTEAGTMLVKDIHPTGSSQPWFLTPINDTLFFNADDGQHGRELWKSDGTSEGTELVKDIHPTKDSLPSELVNFNDVLLFRAHDGVHGTELWQSDGTEVGTILVKDLNQTSKISGSSLPSKLTVANHMLFFTAIDGGANGRELWVMKSAQDFALTNTHVKEKQPAGTVVGQFYSENAPITYQLTKGVGNQDNDTFQISENRLTTKAMFDIEQQHLYHIRVRATDTQEKQWEKQFSINVNELLPPPPPTEVVLKLAVYTGKGHIRLSSETCRDECGYVIPGGMELKITATPDEGWQFTGWRGDCAGKDAVTTVTLLKDHFCMASFEVQHYLLTTQIVGAGSITSQPQGIDCSEQCQSSFKHNQLVTLTAQPNKGSRFVKWEGDCSGTASTMLLRMQDNRYCTARFEIVQPIFTP